MKNRLKRIGLALKEIYRPRYVILNLGIVAVYYLIFVSLIKFQNYGVFLLFNIPLYVFYLLILTSSILVTISIYSIMRTEGVGVKVSAGGVGTATMLFGTIFGACGCSAPIVLSLTVIGLSTAEVIALNNFLSRFALPLFTALILINLAVTFYYVDKLSELLCKTPSKKKKR